MRKMLILAGIGMLSAAAWRVTLGAGAPGHGHGSSHSSHGEGGLEGPVRHGGGHTGHYGILFPTQLELLPYLFPGEPETGPVTLGMPTAGAVAGGAEHALAGHLVGPASHPHAPVVIRVERGEASITQPAAPGAGEVDQGGAATAQPNPNARPSSPRPPSAAGPGRRVSGWSGPGLPGPGRPASPRW